MSKVLYSYESFKDKEDSCVCTLCSGYSTPMHFHNCIELLYIMEGELQCNIDGIACVAQKDDIVFVRSRALHAFHYSDSNKFKYYCVVVGESFTTDFDSVIANQSFPSILTQKNYNRQIRLYFELLESNRKSPSLIQKGFMNIIMGKLIEYYPLSPINDKQAKHVDVLISILNYINEHSSEPITLDTLSSEFGYNKFYFSRLFNNYIGDNLNEYVNMVRLKKIIAEYHDRKKLTDAVFANGFNSMTSFYRTFAKFYHDTPTNYFKKINKNDK